MRGRRGDRTDQEGDAQQAQTQRMARLSVDVHRIGTSSVTVVGWPARTRVTLMFQVPVAGKVAPRTETWLAVMGTTSSRLGGMSAVPAVISTASTDRKSTRLNHSH